MIKRLILILIVMGTILIAQETWYYEPWEESFTPYGLGGISVLMEDESIQLVPDSIKIVQKECDWHIFYVEYNEAGTADTVEIRKNQIVLEERSSGGIKELELPGTYVVYMRRKATKDPK